MQASAKAAILTTIQNGKNIYTLSMNEVKFQTFVQSL